MCLESGVGVTVLRAALGAASAYETGRARAIVAGGCSRAIRAAYEACVYTGVQAHLNLYTVPPPPWVYGMPAVASPHVSPPAPAPLAPSPLAVPPPPRSRTGSSKCSSRAASSPRAQFDDTECSSSPVELRKSRSAGAMNLLALRRG